MLSKGRTHDESRAKCNRGNGKNNSKEADEVQNYVLPQPQRKYELGIHSASS